MKVVKVEETQDGSKAKTFSVLNITGCFFSWILQALSFSSRISLISVYLNENDRVEKFDITIQIKTLL